MTALASLAIAERRPVARRKAPWGLAFVLIWAAASAVAWHLPLNNDVSWQFWVARQLRGGARFYVDILESNPPLWFWEAMPLDALAERLHVASAHVAVVAVMALVVMAAALVAALAPARPMRAAAAIMLMTGPALLTFAEREHLMAIAALPYTMLATRRADGAAVSRRLALAIGVFAATGFALKPHFLLVPLALEIWLVVRLRHAWRPWRPETMVAAAMLLGYAAAVVTITPDYLTHELPLVLSAYGDFKPPFISLWRNQIYLPLWTLVAIALAISRARRDTAVGASIVATLAFFAIYAAQGKGFPYHALPVTIGCGWLCFLLLEHETRTAPRIVAILALGMLAILTILIGPFRPMTLGPITARIAALPPGRSVAVISAHSWQAYPLVEDGRFVWPMRGFLLWMMPTIARTGDTTPLARETRATIVEDLWCHPPDAILFDDPALSPAMPRNGFDYRRFVERDSAARALLAYYRQTDRVGGATLLMRARAVAPRGNGCRAIAIRPPYG